MIRLPSTDTLRALESAARLQSYSAAAREMNLTHGAISHRLRALEAQLGQTLFVRKGNAMHPTAEGRRLAGQVRQAFDILELAFSQVSDTRQEPPNHRLAITVVPALATHFLADRITDFGAAHPSITIDLRPNPEVASLRGSRPALALRYGKGPWQDTEGIILPPHQLVAVASPSYANANGLNADPTSAKQAIQTATLLQHRWRAWKPWFKAIGLELSEPIDSPQFEESALLLRAAQRGEGVALSVKPYVSDLVASGELVQLPLGPVMDTNRFHLLWEAGQKPDGADILGKWLENIFREQNSQNQQT